MLEDDKWQHQNKMIKKLWTHSRSHLVKYGRLVGSAIVVIIHAKSLHRCTVWEDQGLILVYLLACSGPG